MTQHYFITSLCSVCVKSVQVNSIEPLYKVIVPYNCIRLRDSVLQSIIVIFSQISCNTVEVASASPPAPHRRPRLTACNVMRTVNDVPRGVLNLPFPPALF